MITKRIFMTITAASLIAAALFSVPAVFAADETTATTATKKEGFFAGWFHKFVQKFTVNFKRENSPKYSFGDMKNPSGTPRANQNGNDEKKERLTDEERLTRLVTNGKITEAQKAAILTELATLKATYGEDALKNLTKEERMKKMQEMRAALKTWAAANGIELGFVMPEVVGNGQGGQKQDEKGERRGEMNRPSGTPKPIQTEE